MFGQEIKFPFDLTFPSLAEPKLLVPTLTSKMQSNSSLMNYVKTLHPRLELVRQLARENIEDAQRQYKNYC